MRFQTPEQARAALDKTGNGKLPVCECTATVQLLEGEGEEQYFKKVRQSLFCTVLCLKCESMAKHVLFVGVKWGGVHSRMQQMHAQ